ncbi:MAG: hypothetical protein KDD62_13830, partial [Bdellovibrionales bacterium]|nr:hypothetical protein [Bdellovibrionales bacterium]
RPSNPNYCGVEACIETLRDGLRSGEKYFDFKRVLFIYAAIAGCEISNSKTERISEFIKQLDRPFHLAGDLDASYRAHTDSPNGMLLIAGTGDCVTIYRQSRPKRFRDSLAFGGRKFGHTLLYYLKHHPSRFAQTCKLIEELGASIETLCALSASALRKDNFVNQLSGILFDHPQTHSELEWLLEFMAVRWASIVPQQALLFELQDEDTLPCVLSGSFWNWEPLRTTFTQQISGYMNLSILWNPSIKAIEGAAGLGLELWNKKEYERC